MEFLPILIALAAASLVAVLLGTYVIEVITRVRLLRQPLLVALRLPPRTSALAPIATAAPAALSAALRGRFSTTAGTQDDWAWHGLPSVQLRGHSRDAVTVLPQAEDRVPAWAAVATCRVVASAAVVVLATYVIDPEPPLPVREGYMNLIRTSG